MVLKYYSPPFDLEIQDLVCIPNISYKGSAKNIRLKFSGKNYVHILFYKNYLLKEEEKYYS